MTGYEYTCFVSQTAGAKNATSDLYLNVAEITAHVSHVSIESERALL